MHFWLSLYLSFFTHGYVQKQHSQATYVTEKPISWAPCRLWSTEHFTSIWGAVKCNLAHPHHLCPNRVRYTSCKVKRNKRKLQCRKYKKTEYQQQDLLATVDYNVLGHDSAFQHSLLWVITTTSKQTGRLDLKVADLLLVAVNYTEPVFLLDFLVSHFDCLAAIHTDM